MKIIFSEDIQFAAFKQFDDIQTQDFSPANICASTGFRKPNDLERRRFQDEVSVSFGDLDDSKTQLDLLDKLMGLPAYKALNNGHVEYHGLQLTTQRAHSIEMLWGQAHEGESVNQEALRLYYSALIKEIQKYADCVNMNPICWEGRKPDMEVMLDVFNSEFGVGDLSQDLKNSLIDSLCAHQERKSMRVRS